MGDVVPEADLADPNPDVQELFRHYDRLYFQGALTAAGFVVQWGSAPNSSSFGSCTFSRPRNTITLFEPVLRYLSTADRKKALLHEMIHAIIYVKLRRKNRAHGPDFRAWMDAINSCSIKDDQRPRKGYNITTRHDFDPEEPCSITGFLWKCKSCGDTLVRATNQGPPSDACCIEKVDNDETCGNMLCRWHNHKEECGGRYVKMVCTDQKENPRGTQLCTSEMSKSKGAMQESGSAELQENTEVTKPNAEDKHLSLVSGSNAKSLLSSYSVKAGKKRRSEAVWKASVLPVEPPKKMKPKQALVATEEHELSPAGCNDAKSLVSSTSKKARKQPKPEDVQKPSVLPAAPLENPKLKQGLVPTEKHKHFSLEGCNAEKSLASSSLQKAGKRRRSAVVRMLSDLPVEKPPKKMKPKQALVATEKHEIFSLEGFNDAKSPVSSTSKKKVKQHKPEDVQKPSVLTDAPLGKPKPMRELVPTEKQDLFFPAGFDDAKSPVSTTSKKAGKQHKPEDVQEPIVLTDAPLGKPKLMQELVPTEKQELFSLEVCSDAQSPGGSTSKKAGKQHKPEDVLKPSVLADAPQGKPKLKRQLVPTEKHKLLSLEGCNEAKSPGSNTSKKASERHKPESAEKACSPPSYPLRRLRKGLVASEKNELFPVIGCSNKKLPDRSSPKEERKQLEPEDIQKTTVLPTAAGSKPNGPSFVASEKQKRKRKSKPARQKVFAVMSAYLDYYESDRSSGSTEPLVNKRTERRKKERARIQTYSRSKKVNSAPLDGPKKVNSAPLDGSRMNAPVSSHDIKTGPRKDESTQQSPLPCSDFVVLTAADQVVTQATGDHQSQPSSPCLDIVPLQPADPPGSVPPDQSTGLDIIDISDDD